MNINFNLPTSWRHGRGIVTQTGKVMETIGCSRPLILADSILLSSGIVEPVIKSLKKEGVMYTICDDVDREPTITLFESIVSKLDLESFDSIIAVGGGSILDVSQS